MVGLWRGEKVMCVMGMEGAVRENWRKGIRMNEWMNEWRSCCCCWRNLSSSSSSSSSHGIRRRYSHLPRPSLSRSPLNSSSPSSTSFFFYLLLLASTGFCWSLYFSQSEDPLGHALCNMVLSIQINILA